jgi:hypothetical protein
MKPTLALLRDYELALERLEIVRPEIEYENRSVAVRSLEAWPITLNRQEKAEPPSTVEIPVSAPEPRAYAAALEQRQMGGRA